MAKPTYPRNEIINLLEGEPSLEELKSIGWMIREEADNYTDEEYTELCHLTEKKLFAEMERMADVIFKIYSDLNNG